MNRTNYETLINRGRKAGLRTSELYSALSSRAPEASGYNNGPADTNGFTAGYSKDGRRVYQPMSGQANS